MMITPLEAIEIHQHLKENNLLTEELKNKMKATVVEFRLDQQLGNGRRSFIRRTYTCPFFNHQELGCPLPREVKPYGCLAFNAHHPTDKAGAHCYSEKTLLEKREAAFPEETRLNDKLRSEHGLYWEKLPLPLALLEIWDNGSSTDNPSEFNDDDQQPA